MPIRAFLLFLLGATSIAAAALLTLGTRAALNRWEDPVTVDAYVDGDRTPLIACPVVDSPSEKGSVVWMTAPGSSCSSWA